VPDSNIIQAVGLKKKYAVATALDGLQLDVPRGSIYGLLGRTGAGKTTAMKILMGMVRPSAGYATVFGLPASEPEAGVAIRQRTGFVSAERDLYDSMTVGQLTAFTASFFPRWRTDMAQRYIRNFELPESRIVKDLSRGTRTKLALMLVLCRGADLLILDEATSGLDPIAAEEVLQALVGHVASEGATVFFSSHQIGEIEQIADHVAIIDQGRSVLAGPLDDVRESYRRVELVFANEAPLVPLRSAGAARIERKGRMLSIFASAGAEHIIQEARGLGAISAEARPVTLKELFLEIAAKGR
jgi:ABC-2 type transport system ATP-binding protein